MQRDRARDLQEEIGGHGAAMAAYRLNPISDRVD